MKSISTIEQPILFFQNYFDLENVTKIRDSLFKGLIDKENYLFCVENYKIINVDDSDDSIEYFSDCIPVEIDPEIPPILTSGKITVSVNDILTENVSNQIQESKKLISKGLMESKDAKEYLNSILNEVEGLYSISKKNFAGRYPIIDDSLQDLITFIKTKQGVQTKTNIVNLPQDKDNNKSEKQKIVDEIFCCLNQYMDDEEYELLMSYINGFISKFELPEISVKITIPKGLRKKDIYYLFYGLYYKLGTKHQDLFSQFIISVFEGYENNNNPNLIKNLSKKLSVKKYELPLHFPKLRPPF